jgi:threonine/homoserine/homoserine lactone efflux protein
VDGLWGFALLSLALTATPGPDDVLVLRNSLSGGPRRGAVTAVGTACGSLAWGAIAACGLAELISRSTTVYEAIRLGGACYLVALGLVPLAARLGTRGRPAGPAPARGPSSPDDPRGGTTAAFTMGLASDLLNPKVGLFYVAVLPLFIPPGEPVLRYALLLSAIDVSLALAWLLGLSWAAGAAVGWLRRPRVVVWTGHLLSGCLMAIGATVALGR